MAQQREDTSSPRLMSVDEVRYFIANHSPQATGGDITKATLRFYRQLFYWTRQYNLPLRFICPNGHRLGNCRCEGIGGQRQQETTHAGVNNAEYWWLDADSVKAITSADVERIHSATGKHLLAFAAYLKRVGR